MSAIYTYGQWIDIVDRGTSGDQVMDILASWKVDACKLLEDNHKLEAELARIAELEAAQKEALSLLPELERGHYYCDDCWYSCPKAVDGCCDERQGDECDCGADNYNALLAKIIGLLTPEVKE